MATEVHVSCANPGCRVCGCRAGAGDALDDMNLLALEAMDAVDGEAFFRRIRRLARGIGRGIGRAARGIGRGLATVGRVVGRGLQAAMPVLSRVAGMLGPWGRVVSAGLGAVSGLMRGQGLRGALAGAVGNLVPGIGGRLASSLLGGRQGMDDDASLDALADLADAGEVPGVVALPLGAALATRSIVRRRFPAVDRMSPARRRRLYARFADAEAHLLELARRLGASPGARLRLLRTVARLVAVSGQGQPAALFVRVLPRRIESVARRALTRGAARSRTPAVAARRNRRRRQLVRAARTA